MYELLFEEFVPVPMKVLVVELKGIAGNKKGSKRTKVKEQLQNSMAAWRKKRPLDEIWGCIYTNETKWEELIRFDEVKVEPKLNFELVPRGAWGKNYRASIPLQLWKTLLEEYKAEQRTDVIYANGKKKKILQSTLCCIRDGSLDTLKMTKENCCLQDFNSYVGSVTTAATMVGLKLKAVHKEQKSNLLQ
eukprot:CAMPEP_0168540958 /NCGR_PEP_ID=MMETSP0413-20121227/560_1 /TAXON_ID=136452 /ORGANISM="Filamoeba nolandi, Strain NC-AS-23-1" /LENGTH=189 /DNA_ID=CAMNT_0008570739 /DNA_START=1932 /DNA_END=2502 /DNA_ORIENTATION=+